MLIQVHLERAKCKLQQNPQVMLAGRSADSPAESGSHIEGKKGAIQLVIIKKELEIKDC